MRRQAGASCIMLGSARACGVIVRGLFRTLPSTGMLVALLAFIAAADVHFYSPGALLLRADRGSPAADTDRQQRGVRGERAL